jgi:hypothetical protein
MYDEDYREKCKRLEDIIREHWDYLSYELQGKIKELNEEYS